MPVVNLDTRTAFAIRAATHQDIPALTDLITRSARGLSVGHYQPAQVEAALTGAFGVDTQLIVDGSYFAVHPAGATDHIVAAGGWSFRRKLFGSDQRSAAADEPGTDVATENKGVLDPATDPAKIRAFFVDPNYARQGLGRRLIAHCEHEASARGFSRFTLMSTLPGLALYRACGYIAEAPVDIALDANTVISFVPMHKTVAMP